MVVPNFGFSIFSKFTESVLVLCKESEKMKIFICILALFGICYGKAGKSLSKGNWFSLQPLP